MAFSTVISYDLATLPLFLLMAEIVFRTGLSSSLYALMAKWLGHLRGGLAMATIGGCGVMAAVASSSLACAAPMALVAIPEMKKYKYETRLAVGSVAAGGTLGILIPPSAPLIIYGILTQQSIAKLFAGGFLPGALVGAMYCLSIYAACRLDPALGPRGPRYGFKERLLAFKDTWEVLAILFFCLGGLFLGWFTPTEAGAAGASGAFVLSLVTRRLTWKALKEAVSGTMALTGMMYGILIGAHIFQYYMAVTTLPTKLAVFVQGLPVSPLVIMIAIILVYLVLGCLIDTLAMILITIPIFYPISDALGFNPIWFGIIVTRMMEIGQITPPFGIIVFTISQMTKTPVTTVFRGVMPFIMSDLVNVSLLLAFPAIATYLPRIMA